MIASALEQELPTSPSLVVLSHAAQNFLIVFWLNRRLSSSSKQFWWWRPSIFHLPANAFSHRIVASRLRWLCCCNWGVILIAISRVSWKSNCSRCCWDALRLKANLNLTSEIVNEHREKHCILCLKVTHYLGQSERSELPGKYGERSEPILIHTFWPQKHSVCAAPSKSSSHRGV